MYRLLEIIHKSLYSFCLAMNFVHNRQMQKYAGRDFTYNPPALREVCVYRVKRDTWEGRAYGY